MAHDTTGTLTFRPAAVLPAITGALKFLVTDRIGLLGLVWALVAFGLRPALLAAHEGSGGGIAEALRAQMDAMTLARVTAMIQWTSFAGALVVAAMAHVRHASARTEPYTARDALFIGAAYSSLLFASYLMFVWGPTSVLTLMVHDSFIFFDSSYRILNGQTPSADFPTPLGAATLYLPAFATQVIGGFAGSVELSSAVVALGLGLACAVAGAQRLPAAVTAVLVISIFLVTTPATLLEHWGGYSYTLFGEDPRSLTDNLTWAMFYNRWGWAGLIAAFAFLAPRRDGRQPDLAELLVFAALLTFMFYTKLNYFIVTAGAALLFAGTNPNPVRSLAIGVGASLGAVLLIGFSTGVLIPYLRDILFTAQISGARTETLFPVLRENLTELLLATAPIAVLAATGRANWKDWAVMAFVLVTSVFTIIQNAQYVNICSLIALGAYGLARVWPEGDRMSRFAAVACFMMLAAGPVLVRSMTVMDQVASARREETRPPAAWSSVPALKGVHVVERESFFPLMESASTPDERAELVQFMGAMGRRMDLRQGEYLQVVLKGYEDLKTVVRPGDSVIALDMSNPFAFMLGARPAQGSWLSLHSSRTVNEDHYPEAGPMFADADHVMIAKVSMLQSTSELMETLYGDYLAGRYEQRVETPFWIRYSRRKPDAG
jgi:hypothetical protein